MKTFYITGFKGYSTGCTMSLINAETRKIAARRLTQRLKDMGLEQKINESDLIEHEPNMSKVLVLCDGDC